MQLLACMVGKAPSPIQPPFATPDINLFNQSPCCACRAISELSSGTSSLHLGPQGQQLQPSEQDVKQQLVKLACEHGLVTPHTSRVGVLVQKDALDPAKVRQVDVPIQVSWHATGDSLADRCSPGTFILVAVADFLCGFSAFSRYERCTMCLASVEVSFLIFLYFLFC